MINLLTAITLMCYLATCLRLLTYRRGLGNYRWAVSFCAWCLIVFTGCNALQMMLVPQATTMTSACLAAIIFFIVWRCRGNVADITKNY